MNPPRKDGTQIVVTDPDPTAAVKEALELAIKNLDDKIDRRFQGIEGATALAREELKDKLIALQSTLTNAANERATANKDLVEKLEKANQIALTAALQTQKESAAKSELGIADLLKQLQVSFETANKATNEKIDRLTSRLDTGEGRIGGVDDNRRDYREDRRDSVREAVDYRNYILALIVVILGVAGFFGLGLHR
jgi:hypothetical protein